jgi:hypothetical protein
VLRPQLHLEDLMMDGSVSYDKLRFLSSMPPHSVILCVAVNPLLLSELMLPLATGLAPPLSQRVHVFGLWWGVRCGVRPAGGPDRMGAFCWLTRAREQNLDCCLERVGWMGDGAWGLRPSWRAAWGGAGGVGGGRAEGRGTWWCATLCVGICFGGGGPAAGVDASFPSVSLGLASLGLVSSGLPIASAGCDAVGSWDIRGWGVGGARACEVGLRVVCPDSGRRGGLWWGPV